MRKTKKINLLRAALALRGQSISAFARSIGVTGPFLHLLCKGHSKSERVEAEIDAVIKEELGSRRVAA